MTADRKSESQVIRQSLLREQAELGPKTTPPPSTVYKYVAVNERSLATLVTNQIFFANPFKDFNDPFDIWAIPVMEGTNRRVYEYWKGKGIDNPGLAKLAKENPEGVVSKRITRAEFESDLVARNGSPYGIWSVSETRSEILMFSHYANGHRGICIGFDVQKLGPGLNDSLRKVQYFAAYPTFNILNINHPEDLTAPLFAKERRWDYEMEWRIVNNNTGRGVYKVPEGSISEIILGARISTENRDLVTEVARLKGIKVFEAMTVDNDYALEIQPT